MFPKLLLMPVLSAYVVAGAQPAAPVARLEGTDTSSRIAYVLLTMEGKYVVPVSQGPTPRLTAQCLKMPDGKFKFELLTNPSSEAPLVFVAPWKPTKDSLFDIFQSTKVKEEFLGYMKVKPVNRSWRTVSGMPGELKYSAPGTGSANMEEVTDTMQFLRSLPTLRLSIPGQTVIEFETSKWQEAIRKEPICHASSL